VQESEGKFRAIFESSKDGIILTDVDSRKFHMGNKTFCDMLQYTPDEITQLGVADIHPEESLPRVLDAFERAINRESKVAEEIPLRRKDGSVLWAEVKSSPVTISGKRYLLGHFRDITERRKTSAKLARLGMAVDQAAEAIIIADHEGTILYVNPAFERISGYSREEAVGKTPRILRSGKQDKSLYREMWDTLERGEVWTGHLNNRRKDGSLYEEDATISPVRDSSGKVVSFVGVMRDVTQLLSLEKQVRMAQKMEAVGTLAGGIAHDFNNALTGIVGFGELLRMRMAGDGQALHDLDEIMRCAERAATLTRQLLTFARRNVIEPVHLNLSALVADLMKLIGKVVGEHIEVKTALGMNVPTIHADRGQVEQVVMNLCLNARDAMPEGGRLLVETGDVVLEEEDVRRNPYMKTGRYAQLTVSDTGVGMDEMTRSRVFEPFFTTKGPDRGTGLGLAMVYGIVKQHGGYIHLYSEPGKGTAFKVYFPAIEVQPDAVPTKFREETVRGGTETILLAEDEEAIRALAERILTGFGYTVLVARNGEEAIEIFLQKKEIVLAVLDVVMPRMGGKEAFEEMHRQNPRLKGIFMSGYSADGIHDSFVLTPGTPFLQKPFGPTILARKVREVLDAQ
jgi:PAS domain S-box-containing protein